MLKFTVEYRAAIDELTANCKFSLRKFELSKEEWIIAAQLTKVLKVFKDATLLFSRSTSNIAKVLPAMDKISTVLSINSEESDYLPAIKSALAIGLRLLTKYYELVDMSDVYCIATNLEEIGMASQPLKNPVIDNIFDDLLDLTEPTTGSVSDELKTYLAEDCEKVVNVIAWWKKKQAVYPCLAHMALDYLNIPATSIDVEPAFSQGQILLSHICNWLSSESTCSLLCLGAWFKSGLVLTSDIVAASKLPEVKKVAIIDETS
ncbi:hypothetical protein C0992_006820 [Termitomyces sp. T32_za158]|nr:hypothetical protein C0992_006820 [Termitomyces sp. T32_za158]